MRAAMLRTLRLLWNSRKTADLAPVLSPGSSFPLWRREKMRPFTPLWDRVERCVRAGVIAEFVSRWRCRKALPLALLLAAAGFGQQSSAPSSEMETKEAPVKFTSRVNLVPMTVVVRDSKGKAIGTLTKDDFRVFDNGKPQVITRFAVEKPSAPPPAVEKDDAGTALEEPAKSAGAPAPVIAEHFVAYVFDDLHAKAEDLVRARDAAWHLISTSMQPADRAAIYTTSGQVTLEFTDEQPKLHDTLMRLTPVGIMGTMGGGLDCPDISYYMADHIVNLNDQQAMQVALANYIGCSGNTHATTNDIIGYAQRALDIGAHGTQLASSTLDAVVRRTSAMPGQRSVVLASPGFYIALYDQFQVTDVINRAIRSNVIINALDARGLWTPPGFDASRPTPAGGAMVVTMINMYLQSEALAQEDVLAEMADGTGGTFFHNNNDLNEGYRRLAAAPEYLYVIAFTPANLKSDGKFHTLKINLTNPKGLTVQARKGYYAPRRETNAAEQAKQEIQDAVFSREVMKDIPVTLHTQFFKSGDFEAKLSVLARIDVKALHYQKVDGRYRNDLTVVAALFDLNGNYITATQQKIELRLKEETYEKRLGSGITVRTPFDVKSGNYVVRVVVRDSEGQLMAALNDAVDIP